MSNIVGHPISSKSRDKILSYLGLKVYFLLIILMVMEKGMRRIQNYKRRSEKSILNFITKILYFFEQFTKPAVYSSFPHAG